MFRALFLTLSLAATPVVAESWQARTNDNGSLLFGNAYLVIEGVTFSCTAPSPEGRPLIETGSHESHRTDPFEVVIGFHDWLFEWAPPYRIEGVRLGLGDREYDLPVVELNELQGTAVYVPMDAPVIRALSEAPSLTLITGQGTRHEFTTEGLAGAVKTAFSYCNDRWAALGHRLPGGVEKMLAAIDETVVANAAPATPVPEPETLSLLPPELEAMLRAACDGDYLLVPEQGLGVADFDGDGTDDYILSGYGLGCKYALNPFCGASSCSVDVHLSGKGFASVDGWIGGGFEIATSADGTPGLRRFGDASRPIETWNGSAFAPAE